VVDANWCSNAGSGYNPYCANNYVIRYGGCLTNIRTIDHQTGRKADIMCT
jgi:hypothetical protein